jgi:hypothetical protein
MFFDTFLETSNELMMMRNTDDAKIIRGTLLHQQLEFGNYE